MTDFRAELIEAMAQRWQEAQRNDEWNSYDECITGLLDAALAFRQTVECPECGGTQGPDWNSPECPNCDPWGRVPGEERLAIVERQVGFYHDQYGFEGMKHGIEGDENSGSPVFLLAPDLPEGTPT